MCVALNVARKSHRMIEAERNRLLFRPASCLTLSETFQYSVIYGFVKDFRAALPDAGRHA